MKLRIKKSQRDVKGLLGGHKGVKFEISATAQLSAEEKRLCDQYFPGDFLLYKWDYKEKGKEHPAWRFVTVDSLVKGQIFECDSLGDIIGLEKGLIAGANDLYRYLLVAQSFGGEIEVDIPSTTEKYD